MTQPLQQVDRTCVLSGGRKLAYFAGCDYLRLASHPDVLQAARDGLNRFGLNVAASRLTTGNHALYEELEQALAIFFKQSSALLVPDGYETNLIVAQALQKDVTGVLMDEKAHPSLQDAARFFDCPVARFQHRDPDDARRKLAAAGTNPILLTDGVFSQNGSLAPLDEYLKILPQYGLLLVDDAHGVGILGGHGRGTTEHLKVSDNRLIVTATLSKAFGVFGGVILECGALRKKIIRSAHMFAGSTPMPLPLAAAGLAAVKLVAKDKSLRRRLVENTQYAKDFLRRNGLPVNDSPAPILQVIPATAAEARRLSKSLLDAGVYPSFIHYPGGPAGGYFRFTLSSEHTRGQIDALLKALACVQAGFSSSSTHKLRA